jgi:hypothetical protein
MNEKITFSPDQEAEHRKIAKEYAKDIDVRELGKPNDPEKHKGFCDLFGFDNLMKEADKASWSKILDLLTELESLKAEDDATIDPKIQDVMEGLYEFIEYFKSDPETEDLGLRLEMLVRKICEEE